jgi:hypothetical protein
VQSAQVRYIARKTTGQLVKVDGEFELNVNEVESGKLSDLMLLPK